MCFGVHGGCRDGSTLLCPGSSFPSMSKQCFGLLVSEQDTIYTFHIPKRQEIRQRFTDDAWGRTDVISYSVHPWPCPEIDKDEGRLGRTEE